MPLQEKSLLPSGASHKEDEGKYFVFKTLLTREFKNTPRLLSKKIKVEGPKVSEPESAVIFFFL